MRCRLAECRRWPYIFSEPGEFGAAITGRRPKPIVGGGEAQAAPPITGHHGFIRRIAAGQDPVPFAREPPGRRWKLWDALTAREGAWDVFPGASPVGSAPVYDGERLPRFAKLRVAAGHLLQSWAQRMLRFLLIQAAVLT